MGFSLFLRRRILDTEEVQGEIVEEIRTGVQKQPGQYWWG